MVGARYLGERLADDAQEAQQWMGNAGPEAESRRSPHRGRVAISENNTEYIRLQAVSRLGFTGQLVARTTDEGLEFATFVELRNVAARTLWATVVPGHLVTVASLLDKAAVRALS